MNVSGSVKQGRWMLSSLPFITKQQYYSPLLQSSASVHFVCDEIFFKICIYMTAYKIKIHTLAHTYICICCSCVCIRTRSSEQLEVFWVIACISVGIVMTL